MGHLSPSKKAQLHEVADLLLEVYRTLARMRFLDPSWILEGPHDIEALRPLYHSHGLDASIIYLYSILPYIDMAWAEEVDFFQGSDFADFRDEQNVEQGRNPMYDDEDEISMRPWMTPLSMMGNHRSVIIYDARKHCIGILDQESGGSSDHNINIYVTQEEEEEEEEEDYEEDEEDKDSEEEEGLYDEMPSRPAGYVLRDIVQWYNELIELPGGGSNTMIEWDAEITKPLYLKHHWPDADFDGDAFLVDKARAMATMEAKDTAEEPLRAVQHCEGYLRFLNDESHSITVEQMRDRLAAAQTDDEKWVVRGKLWQAQEDIKKTRQRLQNAEAAMDLLGGVCQEPEELPLWEERQLRMELWDKQRSLRRIQQEAEELEASEPDKANGLESRLRYAEKQLVICEKAYEASRLDAERLCPGRSFPVGRGMKSTGSDLDDKLKSLTTSAEESHRDAISIKEWMAQLPDSANQERQAAQDKFNRIDGTIEYFEEEVRKVSLELEKLKE